MEQSPINAGETYEVEIVAIGEKGDGIAKINDNFVVIVPGTSVGQNCTIRINKVLRRYAFGEVIDENSN